MRQLRGFRGICARARAVLLCGLVIVLPAAAAGCGASDDRREREEISQVLTESVKAAHAGSPQKACPLYTRAYVRETASENAELRLTRNTCAELVRALEPILRQLTADPRPRVTDVKVSGERATARLEIKTHLGPAASKLFLVRAGDRWKIDHDEDFPAEGSSPRP